MSKFAKAFVSHSSVDKPLVTKVAEHVSAARWEIDSQSFETGGTSASEIFNALSRSGLFVLIASENSINSPWVKGELEIAQSLVASKKLGGVLVFIVDDSSIVDLPDWLRLYVYARTSNPIRIANVIRSKLLQLDANKGLEERPFVQRTKIQTEIEERLADLANPVSALYLGGVDGIGRHCVVRNTLKNLFTGIDIAGIEISIHDGEGIIETYRKLFFSWRQPTVEQAREFFDEMATLDKEQCVKRTNELLSEIAEQKLFVWFQFDYEILDENGILQPDFASLFRNMRNRLPNVVICAKRMPRFAERRQFKNIAFFQVNSLTAEESKRLWVYALNHLKFPDLDPQFAAFLQENVSGHPAMIWTAAEYVATTGKASSKANPAELLEILKSLSLSLVDGLNLDDVTKKLLALFDEFGAIDPIDLIEMSGETDQQIANGVTRLLSLGLLESEGDHLRLASYFRSARFRKQFASESDVFIQDARKRLLSLVSSYSSEDGISIVTIDSVLTSAILQGKSIGLDLGQRAVVGSHYLRVARACYDRERWKDAVAFASNAYAKSYTLTDDAKIECLRILGLASIRDEDSENLEKAIKELDETPARQARRHVHFMKGFSARWNGDFEIAEREFKKVLEISSEDVHAFRELAQLLVAREDYHAAEAFARDALARSAGNPFIIDILLNCLIELRKDDYVSLLEDTEIADLFAQLELADRREKRDFTLLRKAHYFSSLKNFSEAMKWADRAVSSNPRQVRAIALRIEIKLRMKGDDRILRSVDEDIQRIQKIADESDGKKTHFGLLAKLRIRFQLAKGNFSGAIKSYESAPIGQGGLRVKLAREIAQAIVAAGDHVEPGVLKFANRILEGGT